MKHTFHTSALSSAFVGLFVVVAQMTCTFAYGQIGQIALSKQQLIQLANDPILGKHPDLILSEWIEPNKIGFLPTAAVREQLVAAGVPTLITDELPRYFGWRLWLKIFEYDCMRCGDGDRTGWEFAQYVSNAEVTFKIRRETDPSLRQLLGGKSFDPKVEPLPANWTPSIDRQPMVYVHGTIEKQQASYRITSRISYRSITDAGVVAPNVVKVVDHDPASLRAAAGEIAEWVIDALRSALQGGP